MSDTTTTADAGNLSDGYHTFNELYEHRHALFLALLKERYLAWDYGDSWCSKLHSDGTEFEGWFIAGIGYNTGEQMSYHLPVSMFDQVREWARELPRAPEWDGHTSQDVIKRLKEL